MSLNADLMAVEIGVETAPRVAPIVAYIPNANRKLFNS